MKSLLAVVLCLAIPFTLFAGETSYKVTYDGGSLSDLESGTGMHLFLDSDKVRFVENGKEIANVPAASITEISYGRSAPQGWSCHRTRHRELWHRCIDGTYQIQEAFYWLNLGGR